MWTKYKIFTLNFIPGCMLGIEFPHAEEVGDWYDEQNDKGQQTSFCAVLDLFIFRFYYQLFWTTEEVEEV